MAKDFQQLTWDDHLEQECQLLVHRGLAEDRTTGVDITTVALVPYEAQGHAAVVARKPGVFVGKHCGQIAAQELDRALCFEALVEDGTEVEPGQTVAILRGSARSLLTAERVVLNFIGRLSGIATQTQQFVKAAGPRVRVYDTRKTTPGWRYLEKYAVRMGGGFNHRLGLSEAILIKDNHLAFGATGNTLNARFSPAEAVEHARRYLDTQLSSQRRMETLIEVEVDTLGQLAQVLTARPDIVLLDNMSPDQLSQAVEMRNTVAPEVELEASGTVNLNTIGAIAATGVDRISAGALTHSAIWLDFGLDWQVLGEHLSDAS